MRPLPQPAPDTPRDLGIGNGLADGDSLKRPPYALLKGGAAHVERKVQANSRFLNEGYNSRDQSLVVPIRADKMCFREPILEVTNKLIGIVS